MEIWEYSLPFEALRPTTFDEMISEIHVGTLPDQTVFADDFMICGANDSIANSQQRNNCHANGTHNAQNMLQPAKNDLFICQNLAMDEEWPNNTLPTPPRSPETNTNAIDEELRDQFDELIGEADALDLLEGMELDFCPLVDDLLANGAWHGTDPHPTPEHLGSNEVRHDCMWSGKCDATCKQRIRYASENSDIQLLTPASSPLRTSGITITTVKSEPITTVSDFVDPSAVMSYTPHADHSYYQPEAVDPQASEIAAPQITVATSATPTSQSTWSEEQYDLSDSTSESEVGWRSVNGDNDRQPGATTAATIATSGTTSNTTTATTTTTIATARQTGIRSRSPAQNSCLTSREVDSVVTDESEETESENIEDEEEIDVVSLHSAPVRAHQRNLSAQSASVQRSLLKTKNLQRAAAHKQRKQKASASAPVTPYLLTPVQSPQPSNPAGPIEYPMPKVTSSGRIVQPTNRSASFLEAQPQHSSRSGGDHHRRKRKSDHTVPSSRSKASRNNNASNRVSDVEDPEKRREHNSMERKRRDDLRSAFQRLRELVPEVSSCPKAAKVVILAKAAEYSKRLQHDLKSAETQKKLAAERNKKLQQTLLNLRQQHQLQQQHHQHLHSHYQRSSSLSLNNTMQTVPV